MLPAPLAEVFGAARARGEGQWCEGATLPVALSSRFVRESVVLCAGVLLWADGQTKFNAGLWGGREVVARGGAE